MAPGMFALSGAVILSTATVAQGDDFGDPVDGVTTTTYTAEQLDLAAAAPVEGAAAEAAVTRFVAERSTLGRSMDESDVSVAVLPDATVVWDNELSVERITLDKASADGKATGDVEGVGVVAGFSGSSVEDEMANGAPT